jgi:hypothetical protein
MVIEQFDGVDVDGGVDEAVAVGVTVAVDDGVAVGGTGVLVAVGGACSGGCVGSTTDCCGSGVSVGA